MTKAVAKTSFGGNMPANPDALVSNLANVAQSVTASTDTMPILRLVSGEWVYGQDDVEITADAQFAVNPYSVKQGYICWCDSEVHGEIMVPMTQPMPNLAEIEEKYGVPLDEEERACPWRQQMQVEMKCISGQDEGLTLTYKPSSVGGLSALKDVINQLIAQLQVDQVNYVPVITLDVDNYKHKKHGKIYAPEIEIVEYIGMDGVTEPEEAEAEPEPEVAEAEEVKVKPARRTRAKTVAPAAEEVDEAEEAEIVEDEEDEPAEEPAARKPRRRRRA